MKPYLPIAGGRDVRTYVGWRAWLATIPGMGAALLPVGVWPAYAGLVVSAIILIAKFVLDSTPLLYLGIAALVGASFCNAWPDKPVGAGSCSACLPDARPQT